MTPQDRALFTVGLAYLTVQLGFPARAQVAECADISSVQATGYGLPGSAPDEQFEQALSAALAAAVTQVRGVYIESEQTLVDVFSETVTNGETTTSSSTEFRDEVTQRFSGLILRYEVLDRAVQVDGVVAVQITADICLDERIALNLKGPTAALSTFSGVLAASIVNSGWNVATAPEVGEAASPFILGLETGASLIAHGQLQTQFGSLNDNTVAYGATIDVSLIDARTLEIVDSLTMSENGIGFTDVEAEQDAVEKLAYAVSKSWSQQFLASQERQAGTLIVSNITRSNSRYTLQDMVAALPGVLEVTSATYDEAARVVLLELDLTSDLCSVADALALERRIVMEVENCKGSQAEIIAVRE